MKTRIVNGKRVELKYGKLFVDGRHLFLKTGKPLRNFSNKEEIEKLIADLDIIKSKNFNCIEINCYWHHFDHEGNGVVDVDVAPLRRLIDEINARDMFACLSVETYGVGGGQIPEGFWAKHPGCLAVSSAGKEVQDTEYGFMSKVPSLYSKDYLRASRAYISDLASKLDMSKLLYCETTVEPQYMGHPAIDYSAEARQAYEAWMAANYPDAQPFPDSYPIPQEFVYDPIWNRFRAEWLAGWVRDDAQAFRNVAGDDFWVACEYLDADESTMMARCGDPVVFLKGLQSIDIIQVNWHWHNGNRAPNLKAYQRIKVAVELTGADWVITEHMTINGTDYHAKEMNELLVNTIRNGSQFGWEFVDITADLDDPSVPDGVVVPGDFKPAHFSVYDKNWNPKPAMAVVDNQWDSWMEIIRTASKLPPEQAMLPPCKK
ncbi:MAG: hypothetical protein FJ220_04320 [Kiritimatiellaceae bacterium]|nr:hypothetical protein [Kiritimatiellaceae bacterium]